MALSQYLSQLLTLTLSLTKTRPSLQTHRQLPWTGNGTLHFKWKARPYSTDRHIHTLSLVNGGWYLPPTGSIVKDTLSDNPFANLATFETLDKLMKYLRADMFQK